MKLLISEKIKEKGIKQKELASLVGISASYLANILNGKRSCDVNLLQQIADALDVSITSLIADDSSIVVGSFRNGDESFEIRRVK